MTWNSKFWTFGWGRKHKHDDDGHGHSRKHGRHDDDHRSWRRDDDDDHRPWRHDDDNKKRWCRDDDDHFHWKRDDDCDDHPGMTNSRGQDKGAAWGHFWERGNGHDAHKGWGLGHCKFDPNNAPEITAPENPMIEVSLIQTGVIVDVDAIDADGDQIIFNLTGADAAHFDLDTSTGELTLLAPLTLDGSADGDALYEVTVTAADVPDGATDTIDLMIGITSSA